MTGRRGSPADQRALWHEGITMALYVAVVMFAAVVALPQDEEPTDDGVALATLWGGAAALAVAHTFAFGLASRVVHGPGDLRDDRLVATAQLAGALSVPLLCSVPILIGSMDRRFDIVLGLLAAFITASGYVAARRAGAHRPRALLAASAVLAIGAAVVALKLLLDH